MKRIFTAKEQYQLLQFWERHAENALPSALNSMTMRFKNPKTNVSADDPNACPDCKGSGRKSRHVCNNCFGEGSVNAQGDPGNMSADDILSRPLVRGEAPNLAASQLERAMYKEFMDWWPTSQAAQRRLPMLHDGLITTNWSDYPNEPITHWLNVEDFFRERHPDAATGSRFGYEGANPALDLGTKGYGEWDFDQNKFIYNPITPEKLEQLGYVGTGNAKTQAMLNLHNKLQDRSWASKNDYDRYMQLMLRHIGPGARRLSRLVTADRMIESPPAQYGPAMETLDRWTKSRDREYGTQIPHVYGISCPTCEGKGKYPWGAMCVGCGGVGTVFNQDLQEKEQPLKQKIEPYANELEERLYKQFMDWWPTSKAAQTRSPEDRMDGWYTRPHEPIAHWPNVEDFFQENYPEAATGAQWGLEEARPLLKRQVENNPMTPEELEQHGYVGHGNVITQAFLNLHNQVQGRFFDQKADKRRYLELMLRHYGPNSVSSIPRQAQRFWTAGYDPRKIVWTPEEQATMMELQERLKQKQQVGDLPVHHPDSPEAYTQALQEMILLNKEREQRSDADTLAPEYDQPYNDFEHADDSGFYDKQASLRFWAMADTSMWHPLIEHKKGVSGKGGLYHITVNKPMSPEEQQRLRKYIADEVLEGMPVNETTMRRLIDRQMSLDGKRQRIGDLQYTLYNKGDRGYVKNGQGEYRWMPRPYNEAYVDSLVVHPDHQGKGVAQALIERLFQDNPNHKINPGATTPKGNGFTQHLLKILPEAQGAIKPDYEPHVLDDYDTEDYTRNEMERLLSARRFWASPPPAEDAYDPNPHPAHSSQEPNAYRKNTTGKWYHVSPHKLEAGTILSPDGGESPYGEDHSMPAERRDWVWMDSLEGLKTWYYGTLMGQVKKGVENPWAYIYEVEPSEGPHPWNGTGWEGHVAPSAKIIREIETDKYNRLPDHFGQRVALKYELPQGISVTSHPYRQSKELADEVLDQDGPAILWKALKDRWPGDHHYVARGEDGTIHGVLKGHWGKDRFNVSDLYSSIKAPSGTGNHLLRTVAQEAMSQGKGLRVINMLNDARPYWEGMGAQTEYNNAHASWSPEGLQALVNGDTIMSPNTEGTMMHAQPIPRAHRLPGSARQLAWGRRKLPRSAGRKQAAPPEDAYDGNVLHKHRNKNPEYIPSGPWYHASDQELDDDTILTPSGGPTKYDFMYNHPRYQNRRDWVWITPHLDSSINGEWGKHLYEVEPLDEGPWPWNGHGNSMTEYVSPRARVIRKVKR